MLVSKTSMPTLFFCTSMISRNTLVSKIETSLEQVSGFIHIELTIGHLRHLYQQSNPEKAYFTQFSQVVLILGFLRGRSIKFSEFGIAMETNKCPSVMVTALSAVLLVCLRACADTAIYFEMEMSLLI